MIIITMINIYYDRYCNGDHYYDHYYYDDYHDDNYYYITNLLLSISIVKHFDSPGHPWEAPWLSSEKPLRSRCWKDPYSQRRVAHVAAVTGHLGV